MSDLTKLSFSKICSQLTHDGNWLIYLPIIEAIDSYLLGGPQWKEKASLQTYMINIDGFKHGEGTVKPPHLEAARLFENDYIELLLLLLRDTTAIYQITSRKLMGFLKII